MRDCNRKYRTTPPPLHRRHSFLRGGGGGLQASSLRGPKQAVAKMKETPQRSIIYSRQKLSPHCLAAIFDSQLLREKLKGND